MWWGTSDATPLRIPVINDETGEKDTLNVNAWKRSCWLGWDTWWNLNSGQVADATCAQWTYLELGDNDHLTPGNTYRSGLRAGGHPCNGVAPRNGAASGRLYLKVHRALS